VIAHSASHCTRYSTFSTSSLANALIVYLSGSLALFGIFCCAFGSAIGLLKKIVENTRGVQLRSY
jgi:hypothetical protein